MQPANLLFITSDEHNKRPRHPFTDAMRKCLCFDEAFDAPMVRRAIAAYLGLVSFLDDNIGKILGALEESGLAASTRVIYSSDHGDSLGTRGMWGKSTTYEESAGITLIVAGPEVPRGNGVRDAGVPGRRLPHVHPGVGRPSRSARKRARSNSWPSSQT